MTHHFKNVDFKTFGIKKLNLETKDVEELDLEQVLTTLSQVVAIDMKIIMDGLGFHAEIDEYVQEIVYLVNLVETMKHHFDFTVEILGEGTAEAVALLKVKYSQINVGYEKLVTKEDLALVPVRYIAMAFHDRYLGDLRYIAKNAFRHRADGETIFHKTKEILDRIRILNDYMEMGLNHYPLVACFSKNDIYRHPKSSEIWQDIFQVVTVKQILTKAEIDENFQILYYIVRLAGIVLKRHAEVRHTSTTNILFNLLKDIVYYGSHSAKAEIRAQVCNIKPRLEDAFQAWSLPDHPILTTCANLMTPVIGYDKMIYIPRVFPIISTELILQEYAENSYNKLKPCKILQQGAPDLSAARDEALQEILAQDGTKVPVRILAPEDLYIDELENNAIRGVANSVRKLWYSALKKGKGSEKEDIKRGIVIHIHGGGFVSSSSAGHRAYLNNWVRDLNLIHFSIDYRLAPNNQYPAGLDDVWQAYLWIVSYAETILGIKAEKIILVGDSAGGNLCVALTLRLIRAGLRAPDGCLLLYPCLYVDADSHSPSYFTSIKNPLLPTALLKLVAYAYVPEGFKNTEDPFISPMLASDELLEKMPPVRIVAGSDDPLYDDNFRLIHKLKKLNRNVQMIVHKDIPHAFLSHPNLKKNHEFQDEALGIIRELLTLKS